MATTNTTSGQYAKITGIGFVIVGMNEWTLRETGDVLDATDADQQVENGVRYTDTDTGFVDAELTITMLMKGAVSLKVGDVLTAVSLYTFKPTAGADPADREFAQMVCTSRTPAVRVRGQRQITATFKPQKAA